MEIPEHKYFHTEEGRVAKNLPELKIILQEINEENFEHHTKNGNDFAKWLRHILHKDYLADKLEKVHTKEEMLELIEDEIFKDSHPYWNSADEFKRFIAKEFLYGMIFGLIVGIIVSRLII